MNRFQTALLKHDFMIQYKKGSDMPADYLSRLPATNDDPIVAAFDPFQPRLDALQWDAKYAQNILTYRWEKKGKSFVFKEYQLATQIDQEDVSWQGGHSLGLTHWLQLSPDSTSIANKIWKRSSLRSPQPYFWRPRCHPQNLHQNQVFLLLAQNFPRCEEAYTKLSDVPTKKMDSSQAYAFFSAANSWTN